MFLELSHTKLDVFKLSKDFVLNCYKETRNFPTEEKYGLTSQINRAALSVHLNLAEGCARKSPAEKKRFFEISRSSLVEVDTAFDIGISLKYTTKETITSIGNLLSQIFKILSKLIMMNSN